MIAHAKLMEYNKSRHFVDVDGSDLKADDE